MADAEPGLLRHRSIPFSALGVSTKHLLAWQLNPKRDALSPMTLRLQDWRGLAEVFGFNQIDVDNFDRKDSPAMEIMGVWSRMNPHATIGMFLDALLQIERYDILHHDTVEEAVGKI